MEKPRRARAVMATLTAVIFPVPKCQIRRLLNRLDTMVPAEIIMERMPA